MLNRGQRLNYITVIGFDPVAKEGEPSIRISSRKGEL